MTKLLNPARLLAERVVLSERRVRDFRAGFSRILITSSLAALTVSVGAPAHASVTKKKATTGAPNI